jgi:hypothetical protein
MAYEQKDMSGSLFVNNRKEKETHPDRTGTALIDGVSYYVNGWIKDGNSGKWLSLSFKRKDEAAKPAKEAAGVKDDYPQDDIPW